MNSDDDIRAALRGFADGDIGQPDLDVIRAGHLRDRRYGPGQTLLAVAVVILIAVVGAVLIMQVFDGSRQQEPITPTPSPTQSQQPSPTQAPTPTPSSPSPAPSSFAVNPGKGVNPGPVGGVGDTIAGLRLDSVQIRAGTCGGSPCPERFTMTVTNTTDAPSTWDVFAYAYRDGYAALGNATQVTLAPGEQAKARITIDTTKATDSGGSGTYSWNWSATTTG